VSHMGYHAGKETPRGIEYGIEIGWRRPSRKSADAGNDTCGEWQAGEPMASPVGNWNCHLAGGTASSVLE
jgi:hypothetical protein